METSFSLHHRVRLLLTLRIFYLKPSGEGGGNGKVTAEGNETVEINGHGDGVSIDGNASVKIKSEKEVDIIGGGSHQYIRW